MSGAAAAGMADAVDPLLQADWRSVRWQPPSLVQAMAAGRSAVFGHGTLPLVGTPIRDFNMLGSGIALHFRSLKGWAVIFALLSALAAPMCVILAAGVTVATDESDPVGFARASLANVAVSKADASVLVGGSLSVTPHADDLRGGVASLSWYDAATANGVNSTVNVWPASPIGRLSGRFTSVLLSTLDALLVAVFIVGAWALQRHLEYHDAKLDVSCTLACARCHAIWERAQHSRLPLCSIPVQAAVVTPNDFAVMVTGLPADATESEVRMFFNARYNLYAPDWTHASDCRRCYLRHKTKPRRAFLPASVFFGGGKPYTTPNMASAIAPPPNTDVDLNLPRLPELHSLDEDYADVYPVMDARNTGNAQFLHSWVADVVLARRNGWVIRRYQAQMSLLDRIVVARSRVLQLQQRPRPADPQEAQRAVVALEAAHQALAKLEKRMEAVNASVGDATDTHRVCAAFVTFQHELSFRRCLQDYEGSDSWLSIAGWWLQPPVLRFRERHRLTVHRAPVPTAIVWENVELTWLHRLARSSCVNAIVFVVRLPAGRGRPR
jgi:hypothetical protein